MFINKTRPTLRFYSNLHFMFGGEVTCGGEMVGGESSWWRDDCKPFIALNPVGNSSIFSSESLSLIEKYYFSILIVI